MTDALAKAFSEVKLNGLTLRNRFIKAGTFEGKTPGGRPSPELTEFHRRIGLGGTAMTNIGYFAAEADGRLHADMMYADPGIRNEVALMIQTLQATGTKVCGQLGHCGGFSKNKQLQRKRPMGPSWGINSLGLAYGLPFVGAMSVAEIKERVQIMGNAARYMKQVGFDAIEIHFGHGYGISQFISPMTNKRTDEYGGNLRNRMRFPLEVLASVRQAVGDDFPLLGKISMSDGVRGGINYEDSLEIASLLDQGGIDALICSDGTSSMNPMLLFRGPSIKDGLLKQEKNPILRLGLALVGSKLFREYPYHELYLMEKAKRIRDRVQCGMCYVGGVSSTDSIRTLMQEGFDFIQLGRGLIYDPDFVNKAQADANYVNGCTHCNQCATFIEAPGGIRCPLTQ